MKFLCVHPRTDFYSESNYSDSIPPISLAIIQRILKGAGHEVDILDINSQRLSKDDVVKKVKDFNKIHYDYILITAMSPQYAYVKWLSEVIKGNVSNNIPLVLGGCLAKYSHELVLRKTKIDYCFLDNAEKYLLTFLESTNPKSEKQIAYVNDGGTIINNFDGVETTDCDIIPDYTNFFITRNFYTTKYYYILTSKGCPYQCTFCSKICSKYSLRNIESIREELSMINQQKFISPHGKFNLEKILICDELALSTTKRTEEISSLVGSYGPWLANARVNLMTDEMMKIVSANRCFTVSYGVESYSRKILEAMQKGTTPEMIDKAIAISDKYGVRANNQMMFGFIGEDDITLSETLGFVKKYMPIFKKYKVSQGFSAITPLPGSQLYKFCLQTGIIGNNMDAQEVYMCSLEGGFRKFNINLTEWDTETAKKKYTYAKEYVSRLYNG